MLEIHSQKEISTFQPKNGKLNHREQDFHVRETWLVEIFHGIYPMAFGLVGGGGAGAKRKELLI